MNPKQQKRPSINAQKLTKKIITTRENGSLRIKLDFSHGTSRTKQEFLKETDINNIVKLPLPEQKALSYTDLRNPPDLRKVFETVHTVTDSFASLPSDLRRLMDNDPSNLQAFLSDPKNTQILVDRGVLLKKETEKPSKAPQKDPDLSKEQPEPKNKK